MSGTDPAADPVTEKGQPNSWDAVDADTHNGTLGLNPINVDLQLFTKCIQDCQTTIARLEWYLKYIQDNSLDNMKQLSNEPGGIELTKMFSSRGQQLISTMYSLQNTMEKMGDAFTTALQTYLNHENMTSSDLNRIGSMAGVTPSAPPSTPPTDFNPPASGSPISTISLDRPPVTNSDNGIYSSIRPGESMLFDDFYEFGKSLHGSDSIARTAGIQYSWMADQVRSDMSTLHDDLVLLSDDGWTGSGKQAAIEAVAGIRDHSSNLSDSIKTLGENLQTCAEWLLSTYQGMPVNTAMGYLAGGTPGGELMLALGQYRNVYSQTYVPGITTAAAEMPTIQPGAASSPHSSAQPGVATASAISNSSAPAASYVPQNEAAAQESLEPVPTGDVGQWIDEATQILLQMGYAPNQIDARAIATIIAHESAGNPHAINLYDSNAVAGHPSKGLMQTIDGTFNAYMAPGHGDVWNPVDNIVAGVRYAIARYGSLDGVPGVAAVSEGHAYQGY